MNFEASQSAYEELRQTAMDLGATATAQINRDDIVVEDYLADLCRGNPVCENYGLSPSCPPHVEGPDWFRALQKTALFAVLIKIELPNHVLFSSARREVAQLLHEITAGVEQKAITMGYAGSRAFAGGSCKRIFCGAHPACRVLSEKGMCRNPERARPSMSGYGINVTKLMKAAGWPAKPAEPGETTMGWMAGLVLVIPGAGDCV